MKETIDKVPVLVVLAIIKACSALYGSSSDVVELTQSNFNSLVINSDDVWIVEFFAPWCGHCQALAPEYSKAATALKGIVKVGGVDADKHQSLGGQYGVKGFPTIKVFGASKRTPQDYSGPRTASGIVDVAFKELRKTVNARLGGKTSGGDSSDKTADSKDVIELTDSNFEETVLKSDDMWLVEFYAPWCGHCKNLAPHWAKAATELKGKVKLGALDATEHTIMSRKYGVQGFPTIKFFAAGHKDGSAEEYTGGRTSEDIVNWATDKFSENAPPPEVHQVTTGAVLKDACEKHQLCVLSVLPHILDCQSACRNEYLDILRRIGEKYKKNSWGWIWVEAAAQLELEQSLEIGGFGYPAMAIINIRKMKYSLLRGSFSYDGINEFLREVSVGRGASAPVKGAKLPDINETEPWDGKDGELPVEEDIDLSDIDLDEKQQDKHSEL